MASFFEPTQRDGEAEGPRTHAGDTHAGDSDNGREGTARGVGGGGRVGPSDQGRGSHF